MANVPLYLWIEYFKNYLITTYISLIFLLYFSIKYIIYLKRNNNLLSKDPLTVLKNRLSFDLFCKKNNDLNGFTLVIHLDNLKKTSNLYGHQIGDEIIRKFSIYLKNLLFNNSYLFRVSDEKFMIFIKSENELNLLLENLKLINKNSNFLNIYNITFSIGVFNKKNTDIISAFKYADFAMCESKKKSEFSISYATPDLIKEIKLKIDIEYILRGDLNQLFCLYQPKLNLLTHSITEFEALARINFKNNIVSPNIFIPLAEELNLIYKIDYKVAEIIFSSITAILKEKSTTDIKISFNVSILTLERDDFIPTITYLLKKYNLFGKYIEIELTESISSKNLDLIVEKIIQLQNLNIDVSLDDFSTGFSSSKLLGVLPLQKVKLDKSLLDNCDTKNGETIYVSLIKLIESLGIDIVAEGVETEKQLSFLKRYNVKYIQGYLIGKPNVINMNLGGENENYSFK